MKNGIRDACNTADIFNGILVHFGEVVDIHVKTVKKWSTLENYFSVDFHPTHTKFGMELS